MQRAEIHERRENLDAARADLERALKLDPSTPVVAHSLGRIHKKLDNHSRAVFYMELAIANYRPGSSKRKLAELEIERMEFPLLESSRFSRIGELKDGSGDPGTEGARFTRGDTIVWTGSISERFEKRTPPIAVSWRSPSGEIVQHERVQPRRKRTVTSTFDSTDAELGYWTLEIAVQESREEQLSFELVELDSKRNGG